MFDTDRQLEIPVVYEAASEEVSVADPFNSSSCDSGLSLRSASFLPRVKLLDLQPAFLGPLDRKISILRASIVH